MGPDARAAAILVGRFRARLRGPGCRPRLFAGRHAAAAAASALLARVPLRVGRVTYARGRTLAGTCSIAAIDASARGRRRSRRHRPSRSSCCSRAALRRRLRGAAAAAAAVRTPAAAALAETPPARRARRPPVCAGAARAAAGSLRPRRAGGPGGLRPPSGPPPRGPPGPSPSRSRGGGASSWTSLRFSRALAPARGFRRRRLLPEPLVVAHADELALVVELVPRRVQLLVDGKVARRAGNLRRPPDVGLAQISVHGLLQAFLLERGQHAYAWRRSTTSSGFTLGGMSSPVRSSKRPSLCALGWNVFSAGRHSLSSSAHLQRFASKYSCSWWLRPRSRRRPRGCASSSCSCR